jgi:hypothetical protein
LEKKSRFGRLFVVCLGVQIFTKKRSRQGVKAKPWVEVQKSGFFVVQTMGLMSLETERRLEIIGL